MRRVPQLGDLLRIAIIIALALGAIALECTLYKSLDDNRLGLDVPVADTAHDLFAATSVEFLAHAPVDRRR